MKKRFVSSDEASQATSQHIKPCPDCPWSRQAIPGWLGSLSAEDWIKTAHSEASAECHALLGAECAGMAIYRANVSKLPRDPKALLLPSDRKTVFSSPTEFLIFHTEGMRRKL